MKNKKDEIDYKKVEELVFYAIDKKLKRDDLRGDEFQDFFDKKFKDLKKFKKKITNAYTFKAPEAKLKTSSIEEMKNKVGRMLNI